MASPAVLRRQQTWQQIVEAEATGRAVLVLGAIMHHIQSNPGESFHTVEQELRRQQRTSHIFALTLTELREDFEVPQGAFFGNVRSTNKVKFGARVIMDCYPNLRPKIAQLSARIKDNQERLKTAGIPLIRGKFTPFS